MLYRANNSDAMLDTLNDAIDRVFENARKESLAAEKHVEESRAAYERWLKEKITG